MFSQIQARPAAAFEKVRAKLRAGGLLFAVIAATTLASCQPATLPIAAADPADPAVPVRGVTYHATTAPYASLRPSAPASWRNPNESVSPAPNGDGAGR
jgi:hypothetical protein